MGDSQMDSRAASTDEETRFMRNHYTMPRFTYGLHCQHLGRYRKDVQLVEFRGTNRGEQRRGKASVKWVGHTGHAHD